MLILAFILNNFLFFEAATHGKITDGTATKKPQFYPFFYALDWGIT